MRKDTREQLETLIDAEITGSEKTIATIESMLWVLYPDGIRPEEYGELVLAVRAWDHLCGVNATSPTEHTMTSPAAGPTETSSVR